MGYLVQHRLEYWKLYTDSLGSPEHKFISYGSTIRIDADKVNDITCGASAIAKDFLERINHGHLTFNLTYLVYLVSDTVSSCQISASILRTHCCTYCAGQN